MIHILFRLVKTMPCLAAFMSSLTIMTIAVDRHRAICRPTLTQVPFHFPHFFHYLVKYCQCQLGFASSLLVCLGILLLSLLFCLPLILKSRVLSVGTILVRTDNKKFNLIIKFSCIHVLQGSDVNSSELLSVKICIEVCKMKIFNIQRKLFFDI